MKNRNMLFAAALLTIVASATTMLAQEQEDNLSGGTGTVTTTTINAAMGQITHLNYGPNGAIEGFLIGTNILLTFPTNVAGGLGTLGAVLNTVTYSGTAITNSSGFEVVRVSSFTNGTSTYSSSTASSNVTAYGPTSGTVKQVNYDSDGLIDAFLFTPSGSNTALLVVTGSRASTVLKPLLTVGANVSVTGTTVTTSLSSACVVTGALAVVDASSLVIGAQTIVISGTGTEGGGGRGHR